MSDWSEGVHAVFRAQGVDLVAYVPDAGLARLIALCGADDGITSVPLTTEEEGIGVLAGAWLGGARGALLMQGSGIGNCVNAFSLVRTCRFPLLLLATMRGEEGESNPWQLPMGRVGPEALALAGVHVERAETAERVAGAVEEAAKRAFEKDEAVAVLVSQRVVGFKTFDE